MPSRVRRGQHTLGDWLDQVRFRLSINPLDKPTLGKLSVRQTKVNSQLDKPS